MHDEPAAPPTPDKFHPALLLGELGPGLVTGAADDDPSGIATYSQAGAAYGFGLLWTMVLTFPLMAAIQLACARIGRVTGLGLAGNMARQFPRWAVSLLVGLLLIANTINIGADLAAMGASVELLTGFGSHIWTVGFALLTMSLQLFVPYHRYAHFLKWLTLALLAYVAVLMAVRIDWSAVAVGLFVPRVDGAPAVTVIVALFGTTISPYLFFWQSSQEVEEIRDHPQSHPLIQSPSEAPAELGRIRFDTIVGMAASNLVALAIMIATAATLNASGHTNITTAADAAEALRPIAGNFAFFLFALGIIGTGLLAVPVLAGSSAFAVSEARGWRSGLEFRPFEARGFYAVIALSTLTGVVIDWSSLDPIRALFWSAVLNGVVAVPLMAALMIIVSSRKAMGKFTAGLPLRLIGWAATAAMTVAVAAMALTSFG